jgi:hypothetical protein
LHVSFFLWFPMASPFPSSFYFLFSCQLVCFISVWWLLWIKIKHDWSFYVFVALLRFLLHCHCPGFYHIAIVEFFCYIVITIVSLKLYHLFLFCFLLRFLLHCWAFYCSLLLQNFGIVVVVIVMVIVWKVFVFFHHIFFFLFCINFQAISPSFLL